jgi:hypothetical protein
MNQDIICEILKNLYEKPEENGGALLAKKIILSRQSYNTIERLNFEKPVVFEINLECYARAFVDHHYSTPYLNIDGVAQDHAKVKKYYLHEYDKVQLIKVWEYRQKVLCYQNIATDIYSVGRMDSMYLMFAEYGINKVLGSKIDTSNIVNMACVFSGCTNLDKNIGRNWNTSNVTTMRSMFEGCTKLNKNIGKHWDTSKVEDISGMFEGCTSLNKNIGKNWNTSEVKKVHSMFYGCTNLNKHIGKKWDVSNVTVFDSMFARCKNLQFSPGKNWKVSPNFGILYI